MPSDMTVVRELHVGRDRFDMYLDSFDRRLAFIQTTAHYGSGVLLLIPAIFVFVEFRSTGGFVLGGVLLAGGAGAEFLLRRRRHRRHLEKLELLERAPLDEKIEAFRGLAVGFDNVKSVMLEDLGARFGKGRTRILEIAYDAGGLTNTRMYDVEEPQVQRVKDFFAKSPLAEKFKVVVK